MDCATILRQQYSKVLKLPGTIHYLAVDKKFAATYNLINELQKGPENMFHSHELLIFLDMKAL